MTAPLTGTASTADGSIRVTVGPGGMLRGLEIRQSALGDGGRCLARRIVELAGIATVAAGQKARNLLRDELAGLPVDALVALGFPVDDDLVEQVESTVPLTWRDL